jgi:hypothetical protein
VTATLPFVATPRSERDRLWDHCRNALGIARLLVREGRPQPLAATACYLAVETACRTALEQAGLPFEGDVKRALGYLSAPFALWPEDEGSSGERLASAERAVGWVAGYLRSEAPDRTWGY